MSGNIEEKKHTIKKGDTIWGIAKANKIEDWKKIWEYKKNSKVVKERGKPEKIEPGDVFIVPIDKGIDEKIVLELSDMLLDAEKRAKDLKSFAQGAGKSQGKANDNIGLASAALRKALKFCEDAEKSLSKDSGEDAKVGKIGEDLEKLAKDTRAFLTKNKKDEAALKKIRDRYQQAEKDYKDNMARSKKNFDQKDVDKVDTILRELKKLGF